MLKIVQLCSIAFTQGLVLTLQMTLISEVVHGEEVDATAMNQVGFMLKIVQLCSIAFNVYFYVLCWIYWFSGDIEEDFDRGYTLYIIIAFSTMACCLCLQKINTKDEA